MNVRRLFSNLSSGTSKQWDDLQPISAEIFGTERLRQHARSLAQSQLVTARPRRVYSIIDRLHDNASALNIADAEIRKDVALGKTVTPAAEWLIDNYPLVEMQIRQTRADLPETFYRQLPKLADGPLAGHPRIFGLVWAHVAHTDSRFDAASLTDFVNEYQHVQVLTIGELWAVAISLRLILIENLRRVSQRIVESRKAREYADILADEVLKLDNKQASLSAIFDSVPEPKVTRPLAVQLIQRLRDHDGLSLQMLDWLKAKAELQGYSLETAVSEEHLRQGAANVTVRNIITSLRLISDVNWESWFDGVSQVDALLRSTPSYAEMDFASRTLYRNAVEELARYSKYTETDVAQRANSAGGIEVSDVVRLAPDAGYFLIGAGRKLLEANLGYRPPLLRRLRMGLRRGGLYGYVGALLVLTCAILLAGFMPLLRENIAATGILFLVIAALIPGSDAALAIVNLTLTRFMHAALLPGLALRDGVPADLRTLVVVPTLLTSIDDIEELIDRLEIHFLSNGDGEIYFALATDWTDAATETLPADQMLLDRAVSGIERLNLLHGPNRFLILNRKRLWNPQENKWMGWERKRGKLHELNRLLRGATDTTFTTINGNLPPEVKFVITLDADTRLPRDAARRLVGKIAHPLNRPQFDQTQRRVTQGYGIMQPRVTPSLPIGHYGSMFQRIFSSARGIDPYVFAVSDVYQDLFDEGSFAGKGIYDIDAFETSLAGKIPENTMLSHDLFEGIFARSALVTDIEVVEEFPERYGVAAARQHRWVRGDWQLVPWMIGRLSRECDTPRVGLWKMFDNIRRSLMAPATMVSFFAGWLLLPVESATIWTIFVILLGLIPALLPAISGTLPRQQNLTLESRLKASGDDLSQALLITGSNLLFLGHQSYLMLDAISRTVYRLILSHKNLLEWTTAAQSQNILEQGILPSYRFMSASVAMGFAAAAVAEYRSDNLWLVILPFAIAWLVAPLAASQMSRSEKVEDALSASPDDRKHLRLVARRTWKYFETFVTTSDSMLPPDNFQETPKPTVAHRTSPTNIGLYFLAIASAREFGWIGLKDALRKMDATLATIRRLDKHRGHLYNWYDTTTLAPLEPRYVSTVDSGNLAGHLIALSNCLTHWITAPIEFEACLDGIGDILNIIEDDLRSLSSEIGSLKANQSRLVLELAAVRRLVKRARETPEPNSVRLIELAVQSSKVHAVAERLSAQLNSTAGSALLGWAKALQDTVESHLADTTSGGVLPAELVKRISGMVAEIRGLAMSMEFGFLLDPQRLLFSIGYRVGEAARDESCYDLLASEARLASFFAIAKGDVRTRHWFRLGRAIVGLKGGAALVSWSGSMFEYLMPSLVMRAPSGGLLDQTMHLVVNRQVAYAQTLNIPWGISESAFSARDIEFTYQYSNFGVPGLGLKRGLADNRVVAPYATALAAMVAPRLAAKNFRRLAQYRGAGSFGFFEALDFTPSHLRAGDIVSLVQAYFAHHQGMTIVAILNAVKAGWMRARFHDEPMIKASELLLQERAPRDVPSEEISLSPDSNLQAQPAILAPMSRRIEGLADASPETQILSNGQYSVMLTASGSGYSSFNGLALTRWNEDGVSDEWGSFVYLKEPRSGKIWSAGHMPVAANFDSYSVDFSEDRVEYQRQDGYMSTTLECIVSPEDNAEARRTTLINTGLVAKVVEVTTYCELVLASALADQAHPVFSKLFVTTEFIEELETLVATRRKRSPSDPDIWVAQFMVVKGATVGNLEVETDRARFLGIGSNTRLPTSLLKSERLSGTVGAVLDPVFVMRRRLRIPAGRKVSCTLWTAAANSRQGVLDLVDRHRQAAAYDRALTLAWTHAQIQLRHLSIDIEDAHMFQRLASHLFYSTPAFRPPSRTLKDGIGAQSRLWPMGISGDRPIALLRIDDVEDMEIVHQLLNAFVYWKTKRLEVDLVILNDRRSSYVQDLQSIIEALVRKIDLIKTAQNANGVGQVHLLRADLTSPDALNILPAVARVVLYARRGSLSSQLARLGEAAGIVRTQQPMIPANIPISKSQVSVKKDLEFYNGFGGFSANGSEYATHFEQGHSTPVPWINVVANPQFGFQSAADGGGYAWFGNSRENKLTRWSNDPVSNAPSEVIYVQDRGDGMLFSPTFSPLRSGEGIHGARHGFGYTVHEREIRRLKMELLQLVPLSDSIKISRLKITNTGSNFRNLTITHYVEWVLGLSRAATAPFLISEKDEATGAILMRNPWNLVGGEQVAFADMSGRQTRWTADRREFLGTFGSLESPKALIQGVPLSNQTGAGLDPCSAMQTNLTLRPGESAEITILLGAAANLQDSQSLITRYREKTADTVLAEINSHWREVLQQTSVKTPERSFDIMMNGWLLYQTLACRMWARSGFYQASGAFGFRDQLQDSMALLSTRPKLARDHILKASARQFVEGDFQHWWLPATGAGVRTRISDDTVWLANCVGQYVKVTEDHAILDEVIPFIEGQSLMPEEHDVFFVPTVSEESATLYEHCARALARSLAGGTHGLPLFGAGDWNDGMNRVGEAGKGESIWLGWFLLATLRIFMPIAEAKKDLPRLKAWRERAKTLQAALEKHGWDGKWYRRGYYDDGKPLGSAQNDECQIDSIAQSWAVLSGGASQERAAQAMEESYGRLVHHDTGLVQLFTPPFDKTVQEPGYVKAYPPGIRENGGQYTHGAIWSIFAYAELRQPERAMELFSMLNPINHAKDETSARNYRVEPYVIAADVYSIAPHVGRGGWTWYTGSAGWMYRAGMEAILGVTREGAKLRIKPCVPATWNEFEVTTQFGATRYEIKLSRAVDASSGVAENVQLISPQEFLISLEDTGGVRTISLPLPQLSHGQ